MCPFRNVTVTCGVTVKKESYFGSNRYNTRTKLYENLPHLEAIFFFNVCFVHLGKTLISPPALVLLIKLGFLLFNSSPPSVRWASQTFLMKPPAPGVSQPRGSCCHFLVPAKSAQPLQKTACFYCISDMKTVGFFFALTFSSSFYENVSGLNFSMGIQA